jgi:DNA-binding response OmpR family regulator
VQSLTPMAARILVIDADPVFQELMHEFLTAEGYEVVGHCQAVTHPREVQQYHPHLILLSYWVSMPSPARPLWQRLSTDPATTTIPIILCTAAHEQVRPLEAGLRVAGIVVVYKPCDLWELLRLIQARVTNLPAGAEH